ncbi:MAG: Holliday junction branch migration protein RuvA [Proteobacteria bacterium]|nr:Holliday junction branch migration protein RuvA [Pseudomonadota bacterium]
MFAKLSGIVDSVLGNTVILDVGGVGYEVHASARTAGRLQGGEPTSLLVDTHVREDAIMLFGFIDALEQQWFRLLYSVQGVGPKAALAILSACPLERIGFAIASGDAAALRQAEGVGPKLATRIVTELKDKVGKIDMVSPQKRSAKASAAPLPAESDISHDAVSALVNLGYARADAFQAVIAARGKANDNSGLNEIIKLALKELAS